MTIKKTFEVTAKAGIFVAGERSPGVGKPIELTDEQAQYPLISGEITDPNAKPKEPEAAEVPAPKTNRAKD